MYSNVIIKYNTSYNIIWGVFYMIIIRKKKLIVLGSFICLLLTVISLKTAFTKPKVVATVNLPVSNKVIVLDAGHGVPDERSRK